MLYYAILLCYATPPPLQVNVLAPGLENKHLLEDNHQWGQEESRRRGSLLPQLRSGVYKDVRGTRDDEDVDDEEEEEDRDRIVVMN
jgi:hypothetical protein